jgi:hypothetical protein
VKRILTLLMAVAFMVTMLAVTAMPAFASGYGGGDSHGCKKYSQGYKSSDGKCFHKDKKKEDKKKEKKKDGYYW